MSQAVRTSWRTYVKGTVLAAVAVLIALLTPVGLSASGAPAPVATKIIVTAVTGVTPPDTPGSPDSFVVRAVPFSVSVQLLGGVGQTTPLPASYNKSTTLTVSLAEGAPGLEPGGNVTVVVPAGQTSATFNGVTLAASVNQVRLFVKATSGTKDALAMQPGTSNPFDVLRTHVVGGQSSALTSIGGTDPTLECEPTPTEPICSDLMVPAGGGTTSQLLSLGACDGTFAICSASVVQVLVGLAVTRSNPAAMVVKCDKSLCGGGGVSSYSLLVELDPTQPLTATDVAPACAAKGVVNADSTHCVDYVASKRDNAGDLLLVLLFVEDARVSYP